jgi:hypothetical protein
MIELSMLLLDQGNHSFQVPFYLWSVPPKLPENANIPAYDKVNEGKWGKWSCTSPYLGKKAVGRYYWKNIVLPQCTAEQQWSGTCTYDQKYIYVQNPMGYFFDMDAAEPFLVLWTFDPMRPIEMHGAGRILQFAVWGIHDQVQYYIPEEALAN